MGKESHDHRAADAEGEFPATHPGFRMTRQRRVVYDVLLHELDHPTATDVFLRAKDHMAGISLATVYNCLETLTDAGFVKQVNLDREPSRYCPNRHDHAHFFCLGCGAVEDISPATDDGGLGGWRLPEGHRVEKLEVAMRGLCRKCAEAEAEAASEASRSEASARPD